MDEREEVITVCVPTIYNSAFIEGITAYKETSFFNEDGEQVVRCEEYKYPCDGFIGRVENEMIDIRKTHMWQEKNGKLYSDGLTINKTWTIGFSSAEMATAVREQRKVYFVDIVEKSPLETEAFLTRMKSHFCKRK